MAVWRALLKDRDAERAWVVIQDIAEALLEAGDSIDGFLEGFPSVSRDQVISFLEETKARVLAFSE
jgi:uncharacterized protein (DUF433 family)